jgi:hypothetical protein
MDFIRSLILDIPMQTMVEAPQKVEETIEILDDPMIDILRLAGLNKNKS